MSDLVERVKSGSVRFKSSICQLLGGSAQQDLSPDQDPTSAQGQKEPRTVRIKRSIKFMFGVTGSSTQDTSPTPGSAPATNNLLSQSTADPKEAPIRLPELHYALDSLLHKVIARKPLNDQEEGVVDRIKRRCEGYMNASLFEDWYRWARNPEALRLVYLAADCAERIYERKEKIEIPGITRPDSDYILGTDTGADIEYNGPAAGGFKAKLMRLNQDRGKLVIAVRGTASPIEWTRGKSGKPTDVSELISDLEDAKAPEGFLDVALTLKNPIVREIKLSSKPINSVIFTGHSAGGAVAALLAAHFRQTQSLGVPIRCITFGAPPAFSWRNNPSTDEPVIWAFINHDDFVARADRKYVQGVSRIYSASDFETEPLAPFPFGRPEMYNIGRAIVLFDQSGNDDDKATKAMSPRSIEQSQVVYGDLRTHDMKVYLERIAALRPDSFFYHKALVGL